MGPCSPRFAFHDCVFSGLACSCRGRGRVRPFRNNVVVFAFLCLWLVVVIFTCVVVMVVGWCCGCGCGGCVKLSIDWLVFVQFFIGKLVYESRQSKAHDLKRKQVVLLPHTSSDPRPLLCRANSCLSPRKPKPTLSWQRPVKNCHRSRLSSNFSLITSCSGHLRGVNTAAICMLSNFKSFSIYCVCTSLYYYSTTSMTTIITR